MKPYRLCCAIIALLLTLTLASCTPKPAYTPEGEVYVKTSPSRGDGGVVEVIDLEMEKAVYTAEGALTVPVTFGVGHRPSDIPDGDGYAYLLLRAGYDTTPAGEYEEIGRFDFPDWETAKYNSTEPEPDRAILIIPIYGEFYPVYRDSVNWDIPAHASSGYIEAVLYIQDDHGNLYMSRDIQIRFERVDGELHFTGE